MTKSTSFRITEAAKHVLESRAAHEGISATALVNRLIIEGVDQLDCPGIVFRGPPHDRRAALAAGSLVTENVADIASERDVVLVFVLKRNLPAGGAQAPALAQLLTTWAQASPDPYLGPHWPTIG